jgi:hypothetical protein
MNCLVERDAAIAHLLPLVPPAVETPARSVVSKMETTATKPDRSRRKVKSS